MGDVTEHEAHEPPINPVAIRPQPRPRGHVRKPATTAGRTPLTVEQKRERSRKRAAERNRQHWQNWKPKRKKA